MPAWCSWRWIERWTAVADFDEAVVVIEPEAHQPGRSAIGELLDLDIRFATGRVGLGHGVHGGEQDPLDAFGGQGMVEDDLDFSAKDITLVAIILETSRREFGVGNDDDDPVLGAQMGGQPTHLDHLAHLTGVQPDPVTDRKGVLDVQSDA